MYGAASLIRVPRSKQQLNRRSELQGGGQSFVGAVANKHPFAVGFGATLIAQRTIHGDTVRGT